MNIGEIREKHPQYNDLSDIDLAQKLHSTHYKDLPFNDFASRIGVTPPLDTQATPRVSLPLAEASPIQPGITRSPAAVPGASTPEFLARVGDFAESAGDVARNLPHQQIAEGRGRVGLSLAKFLPSVVAGATELLPSGERLPGPFSQRPEGAQPPPESRTFSKKLAAAGERFEQTMGIGQRPPSTEGAALIEQAVALPFEKLEHVALPQIKKVMIASGFEGDARDLDKGARFVFSGALVAAGPAIKGVVRGVKGAKATVKPPTPQVRETIPGAVPEAPKVAPEAPVAVPEAAIAPKTPEIQPKVPAKAAEAVKPVEVVPEVKAPKLKVKGKTEVKKAPVTPEKVVTKPKVKVIKKAKVKKVEPPKEIVGEIEKPTPARKELEVAKQKKELPSFIADTLGSESGALNLEKLAGEVSGRKKVAKELVSRRSKDINVMKLDSAKFVRDLQFSGGKVRGLDKLVAEKGQQRKFTGAEEEAITLLAQKIKNPEVLKKIGREKVIPLINKPTPEMLSAVAKVRSYFDKGFEFIKENPGGEGLSYLDNYVTQIWDIPKNKKAEASRGFKTDNPFTKKRKIPSIEEGIELGFTPKTLKITEILEIYDKHRIETHANRKLVDALGDLKVFDEATGSMETLVMRADKAPDGWITIDHPALSRSKFVGDLPGEKGIILSKTPIKVHPEVAPWLNNIFGKPLGSALPKPVQSTIAGATVLNAFAKKGQLSLSLFHGNALFESMASSGQLLKSWGMLEPRKAYNAIRFKNFKIFENMELSKDAIRNGDVQFGALSDIQKGIVDNALKEMEFRTRKIPGLSQITKGIEKGNRLWDAGLWDYIQNTFKLMAYEGQIASEIGGAMKTVAKGKRKPLTPEEILKIKQDTGTFVNDSFGGQNWDLKPVLGHPAIRQLAQLTFLSPDWTVSTLRQAGALPKGAAKALGTGNKTQLKRAGFFWARSVLYFNIIAQTINRANTEKEYGEPRFTWDNAPGKELDIFIGRNPDDTERYLRTGKQFREVMEWGEDPLKKAGAKMSPVAREGIRQLTKHDPGSGFPAEFADDSIWSVDSLKKRGISLASVPVPFSLRSLVSDRPKNFMFTWPTSKGMSNFKTRDLFKKAIKKGNTLKDRILGRNTIEVIYISALENGLDAETLFSQAASEIKSDITYDNKKVASKILNELGQMKTDEQRKELIDSYRKRKIMNAAIAEEFDKLVKKKGKAQKNQKLIKLIRKKKGK